jgi:hypothetical protein
LFDHLEEDLSRIRNVWHSTRAVFSLLIVGVFAHSATAQVHLPPVNLGISSFQDAIGTPGWLAEEMIGYYPAQIPAVNGESRTNTFHAVTSITHVAYTSSYRFLGAWVGGEVVFPAADLRQHNPPLPETTQKCVGDLIFGV